MGTRHPPCPQSHSRTEPEEADKSPATKTGQLHSLSTDSMRGIFAAPEWLCGRQILGRVDIERHAYVGSFDFNQFPFVEGADQLAGALVSLEAHRRLENAPPET